MQYNELLYDVVHVHRKKNPVISTSRHDGDDVYHHHSTKNVHVYTVQQQQ